jgi:hypothetical protein
MEYSVHLGNSEINMNENPVSARSRSIAPTSPPQSAPQWSAGLGQLIERIVAPARAKAENKAVELARQRKLQEYD